MISSKRCCKRKRLAKIGSTDGSMQHCHSDLMSIMTQVGIPELITHVTEEGSVDYMVLPSTLIRCLHNHYKHEFQKRLGCDTRKLEPFWKQFFASRARRAWASQHPFLKSRATVDWSHAVPLTVHGASIETSECELFEFFWEWRATWIESCW